MRYLKITGPDVNNGPGCRITLWIPGCGHKCKGCHNEWTHMYNQGEDFTEDTYQELTDKLSKPYITGLTISGGDPLYQSNNVLADLYELIARIRTDLPDKTIWLYTGFKFEDLRGIQMEIAQKCDVIVDGQYIEELRDTTLEFRGSSNQRIIHIDQHKCKEDSVYPYIIKELKENNMKKAIFKGTINGQEFDNVNEYNARMTALVEAGESIDATSSTQIKEVCGECGGEECECDCNKEECDCNCSKESGLEVAVDMLPIFGGRGYKNINEFLDHVVSDNDDKNRDAINDINNYLDENHEGVLVKMRSMDEHSLQNYRHDLANIITILKETIRDNNNAIRNIRTKCKVLDAGADVLRAIISEYTGLIDTADELLVSYRNKSNKPELNKDNKVPSVDELRSALELFHQLFKLN